MEKPLRQWRGHQGADRERSGALSKDGYVLRVAAKLPDVFVDPFERGDHVHETIVSRGPVRLFRQVSRGQKSEYAKAIVDGDENDILQRKEVAIVTGLIAGPTVITTTVNPKHHRQIRLAGRGGRRVHIEEEAIFARSIIFKNHVVEDLALQTMGAEFRGIAQTTPFRRRLR